MLKVLLKKTIFIALVGSISFVAHAIADTQRIDVPAGGLIEALEALAKQADVDIVYQDKQLMGLRTGGVSGDLSPRHAVMKLLEGTPLQLRMDAASGAMLITTASPGRQDASPAESPKSSSARPVVGKNQQEKSSLWNRFRLARAQGGASQASSSPEVLAETAQSSQEKGEVEEIVVTGSRITRSSSVENPTPTLVLGADRLQQQGMENIADVLNSLPQVAPSFGASRTQSTFVSSIFSGLNLTNLRNLGATRSLVLINGRRWPAGSITSTAVDMNTIPSANIERIEVITGGASAVYGADAVAGVVNIITRKDLEGIEIGVSYGAALEHRDNSNPSGYVSLGSVLGERGHASLTVQYDRQGEVSCADRYLCSQDFFWSPPGAPLRGPSAYSGTPLEGRFFINGLPGSYTQRNGSFTSASGALIPFDVAVDGYNRNPERTLAIPTKRILLASELEYAVTDSINVFGELNYGSSQTVAPFEAHPFNSSFSADTLGGVEITIPVGNPFVPAALASAAASVGDAEISWFKRFTGLGLRGADNNRETVRAVLGANGNMDSLFGLGSRWHWELAHTYGRTKLDVQILGLVDKTRLFAALRVEPNPTSPGGFRCIDVIARAEGCVPVDPFRAGGLFTDGEINYLTLGAGGDGEHTLNDSLAFISGSIFSLPAGDVRLAAGVESRQVTAFLDYDDPINRGTVTIRGTDNPKTSFRTNEIYLEAIVPILADRPFAEQLNLESALRRSSPSAGDDYSTWKFGGDWAPVGGVRFRAMQARAVRTPNLDEVSGGGLTFGIVNDPCVAARRNSNPTRAANCAADGVPDGYAPPILVEQSVTGFIGSNPSVAPETADTLTYGFVLTPAAMAAAPGWLQPLTVIVDRFDIELADAIGALGRQTVANLCYDTSEGNRAPFCSQLARGTNVLVPGASYVLTTVNDRVLNINEYRIKGVDAEISYSFSTLDLLGRDYGRLGLSTLWTFYDEARLQTPASGVDLLGFAGGSSTNQGWLEHQGRFSIDYSLKGFSANWTTRYVGETKQSPFQPSGTPDIGAHLYSDVQLRYGIGASAEVYGGVTNVFDKEPPFFISGASGTQLLDTIPAYYDIFGRSAYVGMKVRF